jgi:excisionase family DNA binding protein
MTKLLSIKAAAELLSISPYTVRSYVRTGQLKPVRIGRRVLLAETELERLIAESQAPTNAAPKTRTGGETQEAAQ